MILTFGVVTPNLSDATVPKASVHPSIDSAKGVLGHVPVLPEHREPRI